MVTNKTAHKFYMHNNNIIIAWGDHGSALQKARVSIEQNDNLSSNIILDRKRAFPRIVFKPIVL